LILELMMSRTREKTLILKLLVVPPTHPNADVRPYARISSLPTRCGASADTGSQTHSVCIRHRLPWP